MARGGFDEGRVRLHLDLCRGCSNREVHNERSDVIHIQRQIFQHETLEATRLRHDAILPHGQLDKEKSAAGVARHRARESRFPLCGGHARTGYGTAARVQHNPANRAGNLLRARAQGQQKAQETREHSEFSSGQAAKSPRSAKFKQRNRTNTSPHTPSPVHRPNRLRNPTEQTSHIETENRTRLQITGSEGAITRKHYFESPADGKTPRRQDLAREPALSSAAALPYNFRAVRQGQSIAARRLPCL